MPLLVGVETGETEETADLVMESFLKDKEAAILNSVKGFRVSRGGSQASFNYFTTCCIPFHTLCYDIYINKPRSW